MLAFDFDGVIVDSLEVFSQCLLDVCRERRMERPATREQFLRLFDTNMYEGLAACGLPPAEQAGLMADLGRRLAAALPRCPPFPGIRETFARLSGRHPLAIVTSNLSSVVSDWLDRHGIVGVQDVLGADHGTGKVAKIKAVLQRHPGAAAYYVGDTRGDMIEGRAAGARTVAVTWGWHTAAELAAEAPDFVVKAPEDLASLPGTLRH